MPQSDKLSKPLVVLFGTRGDAEIIAPFLEWFARERQSQILIVCLRELEDSMRKLVELAGMSGDRVQFEIAEIPGNPDGVSAMQNVLPPGGDPNANSLSQTLAMGRAAKDVLRSLLISVGALVARQDSSEPVSIVVSNAWQSGIAAAFVAQKECLLLNPYPIMLPDAYPQETDFQHQEREAEAVKQLNIGAASEFSINMVTFYAQTQNYIPAARHTQAVAFLVQVLEESLADLRHGPATNQFDWPHVYKSGLVEKGKSERISTAVLDVFTVNYWNDALLEPAQDVVTARDVGGSRRSSDLNYFVNRTIKNRTSAASDAKSFEKQWTDAQDANKVHTFVSFGSMIVLSLKMRDNLLELIRYAGSMLVQSGGADVVMVHATGSMWNPIKTPYKSLEQSRLDYELQLLRDMPGVVVWDKPFNHLELESVLSPRNPMFMHHGGVGTLTTATQLGCYNVIVAMLADQPYWGDRVQNVLQTGQFTNAKDLERLSSPEQIHAFWDQVLSQHSVSTKRVGDRKSHIAASRAMDEQQEWTLIMKCINQTNLSPGPFANGVLPKLAFSNTTLTYLIDNSTTIIIVITVLFVICALAIAFAAFRRYKQRATERLESDV